ncbi:MAG: M48 metallopeptidase family protein [Methanotrichaceae archaeon]
MNVIIKRSARRKKTIQARVVDGKMIVMAPASISDQELEVQISKLRANMKKKITLRDDDHLEMRANYLNSKYFGGALSWKRISYSEQQMKRYGSCTVEQKTIRISTRTKYVPMWVEDYVIFHELAHLLEPNHSERFNDLVHRYPLAERAIGFLMAENIRKQR